MSILSAQSPYYPECIVWLALCAGLSVSALVGWAAYCYGRHRQRVIDYQVVKLWSRGKLQELGLSDDEPLSRIPTPPTPTPPPSSFGGRPLATFQRLSK